MVLKLEFFSTFIWLIFLPKKKTDYQENTSKDITSQQSLDASKQLFTVFLISTDFHNNLMFRSA